MPVLLDPTASSTPLASARGRTLRVGLVNNMPDAALARTERQFINMLEAAAPDVTIQLSFYSVQGVPRGELGNAHLALRGYRLAEDLMSEDLDALIVTGTEPKQPDLRNEPYWPALSGLFDWIERAGPSTMFSCLAAHAAVLHYDGIERHRLAEKRCGLFDHTILSGHPLVQALPETVHVAHSRWNEVRRADLEASGYDILTEAAGAGVDLFIKQSRNLLVFHQGHPEYDAGTLFREYRRDIQRFLDRTSETYPQAPKNYFEEAEIDLLHGFRERAFAHRDEALLGDLPVTRRATNDNEAVSPMAGVYRAWLLRIATKGKLTVVPRPAPLPRFGGIHP